jgi:hypothetical protein
MLTDDLGNRRPLADRGDVLVPDATRHEVSLGMGADV